MIKKKTKKIFDIKDIGKEITFSHGDKATVLSIDNTIMNPGDYYYSDNHYLAVQKIYLTKGFLLTNWLDKPNEVIHCFLQQNGIKCFREDHFTIDNTGYFIE